MRTLIFVRQDHQNAGFKRPIYKQTSSYGHFGRNDLNLPWEKLDKAEVFEKNIYNSRRNASFGL